MAENKYTPILANPPFAGSLDDESTQGGPAAASDEDEENRAAVHGPVPAAASSRGGRASVIAHDGVLFGSSKVNKELVHEEVEGMLR